MRGRPAPRREAPSYFLAGGADWRLEAAQPVSVTVEGVWVRDDLDPLAAGANDLVVATRHRVGAGPIVDKLHFYAREVEEQRWVGDFFHPLVWGTGDLRPAETGELTLELRVYDEDGLDSDEAAALESVIEAGAGAAAVAFPLFAPLAGLAAGLGRALAGLIERLDDHDRVLEGRIRLAVDTPPDAGWSLLQPGFLVCFAEELDASGLFLLPDRRVHVQRGSGLRLFRDASYAVLRVARRAQLTPDLLLDQRAATLLSELEQGRRGGRAGPLVALRAPLAGAATLARLARLGELGARAGGAPLTVDEERLLTELRADPALQPYLRLQ